MKSYEIPESINKSCKVFLENFFNKITKLIDCKNIYICEFKHNDFTFYIHNPINKKDQFFTNIAVLCFDSLMFGLTFVHYDSSYCTLEDSTKTINIPNANKLLHKKLQQIELMKSLTVINYDTEHIKVGSAMKIGELIFDNDLTQYKSSVNVPGYIPKKVAKSSEFDYYMNIYLKMSDYTIYEHKKLTVNLG
jgi:hypothetical protein